MSIRSLLLKTAARWASAAMLALAWVPAAAAPPDSAAVAAASASAPAAAHTPAPLVLANRQVFEFRADLMGYSPQDRAAAAKLRIRDVTREIPRSERQVAVSVSESPVGSFVQVDGKWVFTITAQDVNPLTGETQAELVEQTRRNLEAALDAGLDQRTPAHLIRSILITILATVVFWLLVRNLARLVRWSGGRIEQSAHARVEKLHLPPSAMVTQATGLLRVVLRAIGVVIGLAVTYLWVTFVLKQFPYTYPWGDQLDDYLFTIGSSVGLAILHAVPNLVMLVVIWAIARFAERGVRQFFEAIREGRAEFPGVDAETASAVQRLVVLFLWLLALAIAFPYIPGSSGTAFKGVSLLLGLMLSLGSSNVVSQAASGYMLIFSKALRVNDYVRVGEYEGFVMSMGVLSTKIRTPRDEEINVPNALIVGSITKNYTRLNREKGAPLTTSVTIGYNAPWRQVHAMLLQAAEKTDGLRRTPEPVVLQLSLSDFYVEYTLFARLEKPEGRAAVLSALNANIQDVFNEYGVQIMSPHYEGDPDGKVWVPKEKWHEAPGDEQAAR